MLFVYALCLPLTYWHHCPFILYNTKYELVQKLVYKINANDLHDIAVELKNAVMISGSILTARFFFLIRPAFLSKILYLTQLAN